jgi:hypothetical protein
MIFSFGSFLPPHPRRAGLPEKTTSRVRLKAVSKESFPKESGARIQLSTIAVGVRHCAFLLKVWDKRSIANPQK